MEIKNFAGELREVAKGVVVDKDTYIRKIKEECMRSAKKGLQSDMMSLMDFVGCPRELRCAIEMLGLKVIDFQFNRGLHFLNMELEWGKHDIPSQQPPAKRQRSTTTTSSSSSFATQLHDMAAKVPRTIDAHIKEVKEICIRSAKRGLQSDTLGLINFIGCPNEMRSELEMLGLKVISLDLNSRLHYLNLELGWGQNGNNNGALLFVPHALSSGNHKGACKICFAEEATLCRLHPCGHLIGSCCAAQFVSSRPCPFCRTKVHMAHVIYEA